MLRRYTACPSITPAMKTPPRRFTFRAVAAAIIAVALLTAMAVRA